MLTIRNGDGTDCKPVASGFDSHGQLHHVYRPRAIGAASPKRCISGFESYPVCPNHRAWSSGDDKQSFPVLNGAYVSSVEC